MFVFFFLFFHFLLLHIRHLLYSDGLSNSKDELKLNAREKDTRRDRAYIMESNIIYKRRRAFWEREKITRAYGAGSTGGVPSRRPRANSVAAQQFDFCARVGSIIVYLQYNTYIYDGIIPYSVHHDTTRLPYWTVKELYTPAPFVSSRHQRASKRPCAWSKKFCIILYTDPRTRHSSRTVPIKTAIIILLFFGFRQYTTTGRLNTTCNPHSVGNTSELQVVK